MSDPRTLMNTSPVDITDYIHAAPVTPMKMTLQCPKCLKGELVHTGMSTTSEPKQYQHRCECGHELSVVGKSFPHISFDKSALEGADEQHTARDDSGTRVPEDL